MFASTGQTRLDRAEWNKKPSCRLLLSSLSMAALPLGRWFVLIPHNREHIMRLIPIPILAAVTIGLFATAAVAQNKDPGSAPPGVSTTGVNPVPAAPHQATHHNTPRPGLTP